MGYTHYCYKPEKLSPELWKKFTDDFKTILPHFEILLDKTTDQKLRVDDEIIFFNGIDDYAHETFCLERIDSEFKNRLNKTVKTIRHCSVLCIDNWCKTPTYQSRK